VPKTVSRVTRKLGAGPKRPSVWGAAVVAILLVAYLGFSEFSRSHEMMQSEERVTKSQREFSDQMEKLQKRLDAQEKTTDRLQREIEDLAMRESKQSSLATAISTAGMAQATGVLDIIESDMKRHMDRIGFSDRKTTDGLLKLRRDLTVLRASLGLPSASSESAVTLPPAPLPAAPSEVIVPSEEISVQEPRPPQTPAAPVLVEPAPVRNDPPPPPALPVVKSVPIPAKPVPAQGGVEPLTPKPPAKSPARVTPPQPPKRPEAPKKEKSGSPDAAADLPSR